MFFIVNEKLLDQRLVIMRHTQRKTVEKILKSSNEM